MGMERMVRRFVNILAERGSCGLYTLHRLDVSKHLFYPSAAAAEAVNKTKFKISILSWLPAPTMRFEPSPTTLWDAGRQDTFALVSPRSSEDRILCSNTAGHTILYNAEWGSIQNMPPLNGGKGFMPMAISIARPGAPEEDLYVMNSATDLGDGSSCFDMLRFGSGDPAEEPLLRLKAWHWEPLPPPPPIDASICSHTVVDDGRTICMSAAPSAGTGTYCFDTVKREWSKAGSWVLPFDGAAEYLPDLKLWIGFSTDSKKLCAWDLSAMDKPPTLQHSWTDLKTPKEWAVSRLSLLNLGAGRFCIAKTFRVVSNTGGSFDLDSVEDKFAVLTGVEMVTGDNDPEEGPKMVRHKSIRYMFTNEMFRWVL
ncbi:hypothetical protein BAE44_0020864 [Dichanthelium oligosanthes]|uniref:Uncharacterized protein n=1 Tax=Dichanthelium oligosanthes TaxID=888268 RepID=A0A1E5UZ07_9POAL|nr:hypothetical protein BAE44_0020864 [Dichanthelium oligosanthes]